MIERPTTKKEAIALLNGWAEEEAVLEMLHTDGLEVIVDEFKRRIALPLALEKAGDMPIDVPSGMPEGIDEDLVGELMVKQFAEACAWIIEMLEKHDQHEACLEILGPRGVNAVLFGHPIPKEGARKADETATA